MTDIDKQRMVEAINVSLNNAVLIRLIREAVTEPRGYRYESYGECVCYTYNDEWRFSIYLNIIDGKVLVQHNTSECYVDLADPDFITKIEAVMAGFAAWYEN